MAWGKECIIAPQIKRRKKTSKYKLIDWIYEKLFGYEYESAIQSAVVLFDGKIMFRDQETYDRVMAAIVNKD